MKTYYLYLDESGEFKDENGNGNPSLVGGLLHCEDFSIEALLKDVPQYVHASEEYDKKNLKLLERIKADGGSFVIFENSERISVVNGDITYLNVLCEGLIKILFRLLEDNEGEQIQINILIANRLKASSDSQKADRGILETIPEKDYLTRLEEKLVLALGKQKITNVNYSISFASARKNKKLMLADIICNTYITRHAKKKFTAEERDRIASIYEDALIFPVFDNATVGYLRKLYTENRYGELLCQICLLPKLSGVTALRNKLFAKIVKLPSRERNTVLSYVSLQISQYNYSRIFIDGIAFAENYKKNILIPLSDYAEKNYAGQPAKDIAEAVRYWTFDTDFYILTMYDHMGNTPMCNAYIEKCKTNIGAINSSWEHIDYYFKFKTRELNCLIGQFEFDQIIEKTAKLIEIMKEAKELFGIIGAYDETGTEPTSELLGKMQGVRLEAYINIINPHPECFEEAIVSSDAALAEFSDPQDLQRQYQYRSQLMAEAGKSDEALECLLNSYGIEDTDKKGCVGFVDKALSQSTKIDAFSVMHYTNVLISMLTTRNAKASVMAEALFANEAFCSTVNRNTFEGHPWQIILWNIAKYYRATGHKETYETFYKKALEIASEDAEKATMYSYAVSMSADNLLYARNHAKNLTSKAESEFRTTMNRFRKNKLPGAMKERFKTENTQFDNSDLQAIAENYLK